MSEEREDTYRNRTTIAVEKDVNKMVGRKKQQYGDRKRNETIERLVQKDDQLWPWFRTPRDLELARSFTFEEIGEILDYVGEDTAADIGFQAAVEEFWNRET